MKRLAIAAVAAGCLLLSGTPTANAATTWTARDTGGSPPATAPCVMDSELTEVCYQRNGDILWVKDGRADGHHAEIMVHWVGGVPIGSCGDYLGRVAGWTICDINIEPETNPIFFYARTMEGSRIIGTSSETEITLP